MHIVVALALVQFFVFGGFVGWARGKFGIEAPNITGDPIFERYYRVHYNTMEQLLMFIPGILLFGTYVNPMAAAGLGVMFLIGRTIYFRAYIADPAKRGPGFGLSMFPTALLLVGGLGGAIWSLLTG